MNGRCDYCGKQLMSGDYDNTCLQCKATCNNVFIPCPSCAAKDILLQTDEALLREAAVELREYADELANKGEKRNALYIAGLAVRIESRLEVKG